MWHIVLLTTAACAETVSVLSNLLLFDPMLNRLATYSGGCLVKAAVTTIITRMFAKYMLIDAMQFFIKKTMNHLSLEL